MYERYDGLIFDMDGTILDTEPTHRQAWRDILGRYGMQFDEQAMVALNGSPTWRIAQAVIELNQANLDPHALAREKTAAVQAMLLDTVRPLPLIDVVKAWHGRRPMAVGTGSESAMAEGAAHASRPASLFSRRLSPPIMYSITNPLPIRSCVVRRLWASRRRNAWCLKTRISGSKPRVSRELDAVDVRLL